MVHPIEGEEARYLLPWREKAGMRGKRCPLISVALRLDTGEESGTDGSSGTGIELLGQSEARPKDSA
jgi:hypothetical protein